LTLLFARVSATTEVIKVGAHLTPAIAERQALAERLCSTLHARQSASRFEDEQDRPLPKDVYRCRVCRLELVLEERPTSSFIVLFPASDLPERQFA
jgi:hypothetical protein